MTARPGGHPRPARAMTRRHGLRIAFCALMMIVGATTVRARQVVDTTDVGRFMARADSLRAAREAAAVDSVSIPPAQTATTIAPVPDSSWRPVPLLGITDPVRRAAPDLSDLVAAWSGSFLHDFGADGWPDAWSPEGVDPSHVRLTSGGIPFDDPVTGAPAWDLLPVAITASADLRQLARARAYAIDSEHRPFAGARPVTEMRYRSGGGLQSVSVVHAQNRTVSIVGSPRRMGVQFGYAGAGAAGEYDGSRLRRKRQIFGRVTLDVGTWRLGAQLLTNRHRVGAHAGVVPPGSYETIYDRLLAGVSQPDAVRERYRSDAALTASGPVAGRTVDLLVFRTQHLLRYVQGGDSTAARTIRYGAEVQAPILGGPLPLRVVAGLYTDGAPSGTAYADASGQSVAARETVGTIQLDGKASTGGLRLGFGGGGVVARRIMGSGAVDLRLAAGPVGLFAEAASSPATLSRVDRYGFGPDNVGASDAKPGRLSRAATGLDLATGSVDLSARLFATRQNGGVIWRMSATGSEAVRPATPVKMQGLTVSAAVRQGTERGIHGRLAVTRPLAASAPDDLIRAFDGSLPTLFADAELGWRGALFHGDAVVDLRLRSRAWTDMRGRRLQTATGLLILSDEDSGDVPGSVILDLLADIRVREATVFFGMENLLSGTTVVVGNQLVLDYPYPERRLRFGVFWPIFD